MEHDYCYSDTFALLALAAADGTAATCSATAAAPHTEAIASAILLTLLLPLLLLLKRKLLSARGPNMNPPNTQAV